MTQDELMKKMNAAIYDPNIIQVETYNQIKEYFNGDGNIPDASNPWSFLIENNALITSAVMQSVTPSYRKTYPILATSKKDLYGHINTDEINDIFATPSSSNFNLYVGVTEILKFGKAYDTYTLLTIPKHSYIEVDSITFTLLNNIKIYLYPNNTVFCKYEYDTSHISIDVDKVLDSSIITDGDGKKWVYIDVNVKQLKRYIFKETIMSSVPYKNNIKINDNEYYSFIEVRSINSQNNEFITLDVTYSNYIYNPNKPTLIVNPLEDSIDLELPIVYTLNNMVSSYLDFELYTTLGDVIIPLSKYDILDYKFTAVIPDSTDESIIGVNNIPIKVNSSEYTYGGKKELSFIELKDKVINYATGDNSLPITMSEIDSLLLTNRFKFKHVENTILKKNILITKNIGNLGYEVFSNLDPIHNDINLQLVDVDSSKIKTIDDNKLIIEPFQLFKQVNGNVIPLTDSEKDVINNISVNNISEYNKEKIFFNIYKYILDYKDLLNIRVYDVNVPTVSEYRSLFTANGKYTPFVISNRDVFYKGTEYEVILSIKTNPELDKLDLSKMFAQVYLKLDNNEAIYYRGTFTRDTDNLYITITIPINSYIDENNNLTVTGGIGDTLSTIVSIESICEITVYSTDTIITPNTADINFDVSIDSATFIFYKEQFKINFGVLLDNIYSYYDIEYTDRKFVRYLEDVPMTYTKDIYQTDSDGTLSIIPIDTDGDGVDDDIELIKLYSAGDIVYDENGDVVIKYHAGDIVIDEVTMLPKIDPLVGMIHKFPILLLEDVFLRTTSSIYRDYRINYFMSLTNTITKDISEMNTKMLDNTYLKYIPDITLNDVTLDINNSTYTYPNRISPIVTIYINSTDTVEIDDNIKQTIYNILQNEILNNVTLGDVEQKIREILPIYVLTVRITLIDGVDDLTILNYANGSSKFIINKTLSYTDNNELIVTPDLKINVLTI